MSGLSKRELRLLKMIEVCRPGCDDLADPALAPAANAAARDPRWRELSHSLQRLDARLAEAFWDVPVPAGLAERVSKQLTTRGGDEHAESPPSVVDVPLGHPAAPPAPETLPSPVNQPSRRWLVASAVTLAISVGLLAAVLLWQWDWKPYSEDRVLAEAIALFAQEEGTARLSHRGAPPEEFPFSRDLVSPPALRWRPINGFLGRQGVAYDFPQVNGCRATLYVVRRTVAGLPVGPPQRTRFSTGNCSIAAWQEGELLYVLVVGGNEAQFRQLLRPQGGPVV
jgi:hypothetical protein